VRPTGLPNDGGRSPLRVVAFEPDARSDGGADKSRGVEVIVIPRAAAATPGPATLYMTRKPRCSSLYEPNRPVVDRYPDAQRYDVVETSVIDCATIDATMAELGLGMDFLKIDTQGTELDVLRGGAHCLADCLGLEVEVEFQELYVGASVFRDIDAYVCSHGLELFDLRRTFFPRGQQPSARQAKGQLVFGDALYFKPWPSIGVRARLLRLAVLMLTYGFGDAVAEMAAKSQLLNDHDRHCLRQLIERLVAIAGSEPDRKDRFVGSGLQLV
jgi:FkbM family methyltransferase